MPRHLKPLTEQGYGDIVRAEDVEYLQWKLDHAQGIRMAVKRLTDTLESDRVRLPRASRRRVQQLIKATELFQNYQPDMLSKPDE